MPARDRRRAAAPGDRVLLPAEQSRHEAADGKALVVRLDHLRRPRRSASPRRARPAGCSSGGPPSSRASRDRTRGRGSSRGSRPGRARARAPRGTRSSRRSPFRPGASRAAIGDCGVRSSGSSSARGELEHGRLAHAEHAHHALHEAILLLEALFHARGDRGVVRLARRDRRTPPRRAAARRSSRAGCWRASASRWCARSRARRRSRSRSTSRAPRRPRPG